MVSDNAITLCEMYFWSIFLVVIIENHVSRLFLWLTSQLCRWKKRRRKIALRTQWIACWWYTQRAIYKIDQLINYFMPWFVHFFFSSSFQMENIFWFVSILLFPIEKRKLILAETKMPSKKEKNEIEKSFNEFTN